MMSGRNREPDWREFERLVARIEADAGPNGIVVTSPDRVRCNVTGRLENPGERCKAKYGFARPVLQ